MLRTTQQQPHNTKLSGEAVRRLGAEDQNVIHILTAGAWSEGA